MALEPSQENGSNLAKQLVEKERIYMSLLEKRIADLEVLVNTKTTDERVPAPTDSVAAGSDISNGKVDISNGDDANVAGKENKVFGSGGEDTTEAIAKPRARFVTSRWDDKTEKRIIQDQEATEEDLKPKDSETKSDRAFTFTKVLDDDKKYSYSTIEIEDQKLKELLGATIKHYPGIALDGEVVMFTSPYQPLVHNWTKLKEACEPQEGDDFSQLTKDDLSLLLNSIEATQELEPYFKIRETHRKAAITSFEHQWTLFCPGNLVYATPFLEEPQVFEIQSVGSIPVPGETQEWTVTCWSWDWNGAQLEQKSYQFKIERYEGTRAVISLICYPIEFYVSPNYEGAEASPLHTNDVEVPSTNGLGIKSHKFPVKLRTKLVDRGREFIKYSMSPPGKSSLFRHKGDVLLNVKKIGIPTFRTEPSDRRSIFSLSDSPRRDESVELTTKTIKVEENVIVDFESYLLHCNSSAPMGEMFQYELMGCTCSICRRGKKDDERPVYTKTMINAGRLNQEHYLLCPPRVLGYVPHIKKWAQFKVGGLFPLEPEGRELFMRTLELDEDKKKAIWALVDSHENAQREAITRETRSKKNTHQIKLKDFTEGKGNGLVLLFHGPPGVGKTLSAELVAKASGKPLFSISVAEIGLKADTVEANLERHFALATRCEAVLLIDEADVFLESRESGANNERNTLVSVMLRILEYYNGILILTTNRVPSLDIAVLSRIHLAVRYTDLTLEQSQNIWKKFLHKIEHEETESFDNKIAGLVKRDSRMTLTRLNGRQIRNIISSAQALAQHQKRRAITFEDIETMYELVKEFQDNLGQVVKNARGGREIGSPSS